MTLLLFLVNISLLLFISAGSPCFNSVNWIKFTLILFYFITLESGVCVSVYGIESLFGTVTVAVDG